MSCESYSLAVARHCECKLWSWSMLRKSTERPFIWGAWMACWAIPMFQSNMSTRHWRLILVMPDWLAICLMEESSKGEMAVSSCTMALLCTLLMAKSLSYFSSTLVRSLCSWTTVVWCRFHCRFPKLHWSGKQAEIQNDNIYKEYRQTDLVLLASGVGHLLWGRPHKIILWQLY